MQTQMVILLRSMPREGEYVALTALLGVPVFMRVILTAAQAGFTHFAVVAPAHSRRAILHAWQKYAGGRALHLSFIACRPEHRFTVETLAALRGIVAPRFLLLDANTLVTERWFRETARAALTLGRPLAGTGRLCTARELGDWATAMPPAGLRREMLLGPTLAGHAECFAVDTVAEAKGAERFLCEQIRRATGGTIARIINKRISLPISRVLSRWRIHPHAITAFNLCVGLAAGIGTGGVTYWSLLIGGILFQAASVLDGCDGEVAKLTYRTSKFGQYIDTVSDNAALASFMIGLAIHHYRVVDPHQAYWLAAFLFGGVAFLLGTMVRFLRRHTDSASLVTFEREYVERLVRQRRSRLGAIIQTGKVCFKKDCFSFVALAFAVLGILPLWLWMASGGVWLAILMLALLRRQAAASGQAAPAFTPPRALERKS
ncbi:MAG: CDP-alcohol phosphatidyltransferase family protein [Deltaproteobacteria bacterium]|nr:CDP-alcohol phosphatidyltransferase family protein [Deltaproteobacteria bacterium]